jgi:hypothetical protein
MENDEEIKTEGNRWERKEQKNKYRVGESYRLKQIKKE